MTNAQPGLTQARLDAKERKQFRLALERSQITARLEHTMRDHRAAQEWVELQRAMRLSLADEEDRQARVALKERLIVEESGVEDFWQQLPWQLHWLRQPTALRVLLGRPAWLDDWRRGEEERAAQLWSKLPNDLILRIISLHNQDRAASLPYFKLRQILHCGWNVIERQMRGQPHVHAMIKCSSASTARMLPRLK